MGKRRVLRAAPTAAVAVAGVLLGHWLAYLAALPRGLLRSETLAATGHGYWHEAVRAAVALGVSGVAALLLSHLRSRGQSDPGPDRFSALILRLGLIQGVAFVCIEAIERVAAHVPVSGVLHGRVLVLGLALQVLTACLGALVLLSLHRAAEELVRILRNAPARSRPRNAPHPHPAPLRLRPALAGASGVRGPPALR